MNKYYSGLKQILPMQKCGLEWVTHEIKVTRIKSGLWGVRCFVNGDLNQEIRVQTRGDIGRAAREMLRWEDKMGNWSDLAINARNRIGRKEVARRKEVIH